MKLQVTVDIPEQRIKDTLISAVEQGIYYWAMITDFSNRVEDKKEEPEEFYDRVLADGWWEVTLKNDDGYPSHRVFKLNRLAIERGIKVMSEKYPQHFADFMAESGDAVTGDVLVQCTLFGELVYG